MYLYIINILRNGVLVESVIKLLQKRIMPKKCGILQIFGAKSTYNELSA